MRTDQPALRWPEHRSQLPNLWRRVTIDLPGADDGATPPRATGYITLESEDVRLLALTAEGLTPAGVGRRMDINERTVRRRLNRICERLNVSTPMQAVVWAVRNRVI
jgi:DNA-binding NarL/FixJ family response regulator